MNYELAKELKDAGFPQHPEGDYGTHDCGCTNIYYCTPTLSELIEACGDGFGSIQRKKYSDIGFIWHARKYPFDGEVIDATSPAEAVARLWLALRKV